MSSIKVDIDKNEWWPVYTLDTEHVSDSMSSYTIDEELVKKYKELMKEFHKMQDILRDIEQKELID
jgi:hypothetical protein